MRTMTSAAPSFSGGETGLHFRLLFQLLLVLAPFQVHVAAKAGTTVTSAARLAAQNTKRVTKSILRCGSEARATADCREGLRAGGRNLV
jgi:hypothetical protein